MARRSPRRVEGDLRVLSGETPSRGGRNPMKQWIAMAIGAHPDDIEFMMAGTLLLLKQAGAEIHMWNLANGCCGSMTRSRDEIARLRQTEAAASAREAGAVIHAPLVDDLAVFYQAGLLARVAAVIRQVQPRILLIPSPQDYMEDHSNTCRLAVTAAFARGMPNFVTDPVEPPYQADVALYHAQPYGLHDGLRQRICPTHCVDIGGVLPRKKTMLAKHETQKDWLDASQGLGAYVQTMEDMCREVGSMSGRFTFAEGWRRHLHLGFGPPDFDPLSELLGGACWLDQAQEREP
jgi:N-acetylglucosamine malate deacetylase 1